MPSLSLLPPAHATCPHSRLTGSREMAMRSHVPSKAGRGTRSSSALQISEKQLQAFLSCWLHRDEAAAAHKAVHERLVFELFGIREKFRENFSASASDKPQRIRQRDEPYLYITPLRCVFLHCSGRNANYSVHAGWRHLVFRATATAMRNAQPLFAHQQEVYYFAM